MKRFIITGNTATFIPRLVVGLIFLSEGIQKYLFPDALGAGRFAKIGFSNPAFWASFTGAFEIACGICILAGFLTRFAAVPLLIIMATAFVTTKWPMLMDKGFWPTAHEYRTDFALTMLLIFLLKYGGGLMSVDKKYLRLLSTVRRIYSYEEQILTLFINLCSIKNGINF